MTPRDPRGLAERAMHSPALAAIYERVWRPTVFFAATRLTMDAERRIAARDLRLAGAHRLLDVACGPGNFTRPLSAALATGGLAVGVDVSVPMLAHALVDNTGPRVAYLRADARRLPFADATFDSVCCFGALYLIPDPFDVLREMIRVLAPGGRIGVMTSLEAPTPTRRRVRGFAAQRLGLRLFGRDDITGVFADAGLVEIEQRLRGVTQYVNATKPG